MPEESVSEIDVVSVSTTYEATDKQYKIIEIPSKIVPVETVYDISEVLARIERNTNARNQWQILIDQDQAIIDGYNKIYVKPVEEPIETTTEEETVP